ncbi:MAG: outer membrane protein assembly factor BamA [Acidobacteriota bacterium]|nr:outer membrane protein assembly factor BamA [Acidobacteriota bacterium]
MVRLFSFLLAFLFVAGAAFAQQGIIEDIRVHGNRRIPAETIRARMFTRPGDVFDPSGLERDFNSLWNAGYFDDLRIEREQSPKGWILHVYVKEKPTIREIKYIGLNAVTQSDVLDKFKELKVGLSQESQFDPTRVKKAEVVLKELLAAHGHQFAKIVTEVRQIPPAAVGITFNIKEGPKVKVGKIKFEGNKKVSSRYLRAAMKNSRPIGVPHSIILENLFARTYDATKLSEDAERVRFAYQDKGYFKAIVEDPKAKIHDTNGIAWYFPIRSTRGKAVDITVPVEDGERYRLKAITFSNNKALNNSAGLRRLFKIKDGEWFNRTAVGKGLEELRKAYGSLGYINETNVPETEIDEEHKTITMKIDVDEGKQFFVRRVEFTGNTTTRDKVIRRELALEEGQIYNSRLWEMSLLRLNQLNFFETLKPEQDSEVHQDVANSTVDITLKVKEKGKNQIGLNGGMSGMAGAFVGLNYQTNNFLGLGETLSVSASLGSYQRDAMFGFTEPYFLDKPLQLGFTVFTRNYKYNQAKQASIASGTKSTLSQAFQNSLQNFSQQSTGFTVSGSYPLHRSFKRIGLTYSFDTSDITTYTSASQNYFEYLAFRNVGGPNALQGIVTSKLVPSFSSSTIDNPMRPHRGRSYFIGMDIAGIGGNVADIRPVTEYKQFIPMKGLRARKDGMQTLGIRLQGSFITGFAGKTAPPFERFFQGGDTDLRGFDVRSISPVAFISDKQAVTLTDRAGSAIPVDTNNLNVGAYTVTVPINRLVYPGGDTSLVANFEYRIPIAGPVTFAFFTDTGMNMAVRQSQLRLSDEQISSLDNTPFGCPNVTLTHSGVNGEAYTCTGTQFLKFAREITPVAGTNYQVRMSTGAELQVILPVVNAPFRIYYAYNPLRVDTWADPKVLMTRSMFPVGDAGDYTYANAVATYTPNYRVREPRKTFRFTVATTF